MSCVSSIALGSAAFPCRVAHVLTSASQKWIGPDRCSKFQRALALTLPTFAILSFWNQSFHKTSIISLIINRHQNILSGSTCLRAQNANGTKGTKNLSSHPGSQTMWSSPAKAMIDGTLRSFQPRFIDNYMGWVAKLSGFQLMKVSKKRPLVNQCM